MHFRRIAHFSAAILALAVLGGPTLAQGGQGAAGRQGRGQGRNRRVNVASLPVNVIDAIVTLNAEQKSKITAIHDKYEADVRALRPAAGAAPDPANRQKLTELSRQANQDVENVLNADQKSKLQAALKDMPALLSLGIPIQVLPDLKLTEDQKTKLVAIGKDATEKLQALSPEDRRAKGRDIRTDAHNQALAVLNADQKKVLDDYLKAHPRGNRNRGGA